MIMMGLGFALLVGMVCSSALHLALEHPSPRVRRAFYAHFPQSVALAVAGISGMGAQVAPGVDPDVGALVGILLGYVLYRVVDQALNGRPVVFTADQVVVVPADWH